MKRLSSEVLRTIGGEVRRRREAAGYTLDAVAQRAALHKNYIARVELGQADMSISALWSIAGALECDLADLLPSARHGLTPDVVALARTLSEVDPEARAALLLLVNRLSPARRRRGSGAP